MKQQQTSSVAVVKTDDCTITPMTILQSRYFSIKCDDNGISHAKYLESIT